jgi:apolipoprotein N-acyltransferase
MTAGTNSHGFRRVVYFSLAWTFVLWLREWLLTGFPWNPVANIAINSTAVSGIMSVIGALGLTFIIIGLICSVPEYLRTRAKKQFVFFGLLMAAAVLWNVMGSVSTTPMCAKTGDCEEISVRIVQPAFDMNQKFDKAAADKNVKKLIELSRAKGANPDLIIWPETAYPYLTDNQAKMPALGLPLVVGSVYYENGKLYNAMLLADKGGNVVDKYFKHHLVPFGEYRPFGDIIPTPGRLEAGNGPKLMNGFVPAICYEVVFSDSLIPKGANPKFIMNITNDAWFGRSWGPRQHLDMARRQAIETGLPVARANYSGISAIIDSRGRILKSIPLGGQGVLDGKIPAAHETIYRKIGLNGVMLIIVLICGILLLFRRRVPPAVIAGNEQSE